MPETAGYYSLIQYCPDPLRLEAANVGVVLLRPAPFWLDVRMAQRNRRITRFFEQDDYDISRIRSMKTALRDRIVTGGEIDSPATFATFASLQCNLLRLTAPLGCRVAEEPAQTLDRLFDSLIGEEQRQTNVVGVKRRLRDGFASQELLGRVVQEDVKVMVPRFERVREFPFAWQNGSTNLIEPVRFGTDDARSIEATASRLAVEGQSLAEEPPDGFDECEVHLVAEFAAKARQFQSIVRKIVEPHKVQFFDAANFGHYLQTVRAKGHAFARGGSSTSDG